MATILLLLTLIFPTCSLVEGAFSSQSLLDGRSVGPSIVCPLQTDMGIGGLVFGQIQDQQDLNVWYFTCHSGLWKVRDDRQLASANGTTEVQQLLKTTPPSESIASTRICGFVQYIQEEEENATVTGASDPQPEPTRLIALNKVSLNSSYSELQLVEYTVPFLDSGNMTQTLLATLPYAQTSSVPFQYRDCIYFALTPDLSEQWYQVMEYNMTSQQHRVVTVISAPLQNEQNQPQIRYDSVTERIIFIANGVWTIQLPISESTILPMLATPLLKRTQCATPTIAVQFDSHLIATCGLDLYAWAMVNGSIVDSGTLLFSTSNPATSDTCQLTKWTPPALVWIAEERTLVMSCFSGLVSSVAIQWPSGSSTSVSTSPSPSTMPTDVIMTPLISTYICSSVYWISIDIRDSSIWLKCLEGLVQTLGRSFQTLYSTTLFNPGPVMVDQTRHLTYFAMKDTLIANTTIVRVRGTHTRLSDTTCNVFQMVYDEPDQAIWMLCFVMKFTKYQLARMNVREDDGGGEGYGVTTYQLLQPIAHCGGLFRLQANSSSSAPISQFLVSNNYESAVLALLLYLPHQQAFTPISFLVNGALQSNFSVDSGTFKPQYLSSLPLSTRVAMVVLNQTYPNDGPSISVTEFMIMRWSNNTEHTFEILHQVTFDFHLPGKVLIFTVIDTMREILFLCSGATLKRFDINTAVIENFAIPMIDLSADFACNNLVLDQKRRQLIISQGAIDYDVGSTLIIFDDMTHTFQIGIHPYSTATPTVNTMALIEDSRQLMLAMVRGDDSQPMQLLTITQRWTCFPGTSWTVNGLCEVCPAGKFRGFVDYENATLSIPQCETCPLGSIAPSTGTIECQACPKGRFADYNIGQVCSPCGLGFYANQTGLTECQSCVLGRYADSTTASECSLCDVGHYSFVNASAGCNFCRPGQNQSLPGQTSCSDCPVATYAPDIGYSVCLPCDLGSYSHRNGSSVCFPCNGGSASNVTGLPTACPPCEAGFYSPDIGLHQCIPCDRGFYSDRLGASACFPCSAGTASNVSALATECPLCPSGTESSEIEGTECTPCPLGYFSLEGSSCAPCAVNTYSPQQGANCVSCTGMHQLGLECESGLANVRSGWWAYQQYDAGQNMSIYRTAQCPDGYCPGTSLQQVNASSTVIYCNSPRNNSADNWLCAECIEGHIAWGSSCQPCIGPNIGLMTLLLVIAFFIVLFLLRSNSAAGPLTILVFFLQISALELGPVKSYIDWIQFANLGAHSTRSCIMPLTPIQQKILTLFVPLMLFIVLGIVGAVHHVLDKCMSPPSSSSLSSLFRTILSRIHSFIYNRTRKFVFDRYIGVVQAILIFSYTSITATVVQSLHCVEVAPGINRLFSTPQIDCQTNEYRHHLLPFAYIWLMVYVIGFPLAMLTFLWRHRPIIDYISSIDVTDGGGGSGGGGGGDVDIQRPPQIPGGGGGDGGGDSEFSISSIDSFDLRWAHFFRPYRSVVWYWQPIAMLRRLLFALISVLLIESPTSKNVMYSFVGFVSLMLHLLTQPFHSDKLNFLEVMSYSLLICISYLLTSQVPPWPTFVPILLFLLVVPFALGLVIVVFRASYMKMKSGGGSVAAVDASVNGAVSPSLGIDVASPLSPSISSSSFQSSLVAAHPTALPLRPLPSRSSPSITFPSSNDGSLHRPLLLDDPSFDGAA